MKHVQGMHYAVLGVILIGGIVTFLYVRPNTSLQLAVGIITSVSYIAWGLIHHALQKDLHRKIVVEYLLIGAIAVVLLATILRT
jgi:hypothetical protein